MCRVKARRRSSERLLFGLRGGAGGRAQMSISIGGMRLERWAVCILCRRRGEG